MLSNAELKKLHEVEVEILDEVDSFCKKNNIKYCLCGGTLLGAIRHKGFIPWDDDIDIIMFREDYDKFIKEYSKIKDGKYFVQSYETDNNFWQMFAKVRKKNTLFNEKRFEHLDVNKEISIDIFPVDNAPDTGYDTIKYRANMIKVFNSAVMLKLKMKKLNECNFKVLTWCLSFFPIKFLNKKLYKWITKDKDLDSKYCVSYCSTYSIRREYVLKEQFFPFGEALFEGKKYPIPNHYKEYLTSLYGDDYMKLPPKEKRVNHNVVDVSFDVSGDKDEK